MKMKNLIIFGAALLVTTSGALGSFGVSVDLGSLQDELGDPLVEKGMLYLVSGGADGVFSLPEAGAIIDPGSDDAIVESWDLTAEPSEGGEYIVGSGEVSFSGLAEGNELAIIWFPNLTQGNQLPADGEAYGFYRSAAGGGGDAWMVPTDGTLLHSLKFFTGASNPLVSSSDVPALISAASFAAGQDATPPVINIAGLTAGEPNPGTATFSWTGSTAVGGGFSIERRLQGENDWSELGSVGNLVTSFDDSSIGRGKNYEYRLTAVNGFGSETTAAQSIETLRSTLANIATRGVLGSGDQGLILGFVIKGTGPIDILTRAQGPELGKLISAPTAIDPQMTLVETDWTSGSPVNVEIQTNDDWGDTQLAEIKELFDPATFAQPNTEDASLDAGMALSLDGTRLFTVVVTDKGDANGLAIVEVFDKSRQSVPNDLQNRLVNVATRGFVGTGDERLIAGFIVDGQVDSKLLLRGLGPSMGIDGTIVDPKITLFRTDFTQPGFPQIEVAVNDNWEDAANSGEIAAISQEVGATELPTGSKDAILLVDAVPGLYSFVMEGVGATTGIGLVEVFLAD